jgi:membrane fusion protein, multidrug efflux system
MSEEKHSQSDDAPDDERDNSSGEGARDANADHEQAGDRRESGDHDQGGEKSGDKKGDKQDGKQDDRKTSAKRSKKPLVIIAGVAVLLVIGGFVWWFVTRNQVSTDDAYTDGNAVTIAPKVSGYVVTLNIDDNVYVHKGDLLLVIDKRDYQAQVDQARSQLGLANAQLDAAQVQLDIARVQYPAEYQQAKAQSASARADMRQAQAAYDRQHDVDIRATSQQNIDAADAQQVNARSGVQQADARLRTAQLVPQQIRAAATAVEERHEQVEQAKAQLESAELNLAWCEIRAPSDGWVTRRNVQLGSFLQAGASLFSIVTPQVWVTANFKESQLDRMRRGDKATIDIDAYPHLTLHGHVDSIQSGSGSRFSAFPTENATGNFVKVVQRVPVKIVIDDGLPDGHKLPLGLSAEPTVYLK